jgi:hypothetical protein
MADQAHSARTPAVGSHHIGGDRSFVEKYQARGVKQPLLAYLAPPRPSHVGPLALCGLQAFFDGDVVASEETRERTTAGLDAALSQRANHLIQRQIRLLPDQSEDSLRVLLQRRNNSSTPHRPRPPVAAKALHPSDCGTNADVELFGCLPSRSASFYKINDSHSYRTRIRSLHSSSPRRIKCAKIRSFGAPCESPDSRRPGRTVSRADKIYL